MVSNTPEELEVSEVERAYGGFDSMCVERHPVTSLCHCVPLPARISVLQSGMGTFLDPRMQTLYFLEKLSPPPYLFANDCGPARQHQDVFLVSSYGTGAEQFTSNGIDTNAEN